MFHSDSAIVRAAGQVLADQGFRQQHHLTAHDEVLARRHAERSPRVSSAKLASSFDLPEDPDSNHQLDTAMHTTTNSSSNVCSSDPSSAPCANPKSDRATHQHSTQGVLRRMSDALG
jgi:hypothetical protein